jgi:RNA polymerase sigma-70 factor (ECF subfamily)
VERPTPWVYDPRKAYDQKELSRVLADCLDGLKGRVRQAFVLRQLEGCKTPEICKDLGIRPNHLWVLLHRARKQMKDCLEKKWERE